MRQNPLDQVLLLAGEEDPIFFTEYFLGIHLNPFQKRLILKFVNHKQLMAATANQVGKTMTLAIVHIWFNFYKRGLGGDPEMLDRVRYETLNVSPISRQSRECLRYIEEILSGNLSWEEDGKRYINDCKIAWFYDGKNEQTGQINFRNNTTIFCLSTSEDKGAGLAGKQFALITYDECDQSLHLREELPARIFSRTAKYAGTVALIASPDDLAPSQQYWFHLYNEALRGDKQWELVTGVYDENIFIPKAKRDEYKKRLFIMSPERYKQVVLGQFLASAERMFSPELVEGMWNGKKEATPSIPDREYALIIDWGVAEGGDETVMIIADITDSDNAEIVYSYGKIGGDPVELMAMAAFLRLEYNNASLVMDTAEMGGTMFKKMMTKLNPIGFGQGNKPDALFFVQVRLRNNMRKGLTDGGPNATARLKSYYLPKLEEQLSSYKLEDQKLKQDWVMTVAMLCWFLDKYRKAAEVKTFSLKSFYK